MTPIQTVLIQAGYYAVTMFLTVMFIGAWQRGFFTTYFKVRFSFGKFVMVKVRSPLRDYVMKGRVEEGFLLYDIKTGWFEKDIIRLNIPQKGPSPFYKFMGVMWCDVDDEKHSVCQTDYSTCTGYDAIKNNNLHQRALMRPNITNGYEKIMMFLLVLLIIAVIVDCVLSYNAGKHMATLEVVVKQALQKGTVIGQTII